MKFLWIIPLLGALLAGFVVMITIASSKGAPQEAAGFALACAVVIIPYVFTRALIGLGSAGRRESTDRIVEALDRAGRAGSAR